MFYEKLEFRVEKVIKRKGDKLYFTWKEYDNSFSSWIDNKVYISLYKVSNFAEPFTRSKTIIEVELDLSNHAKIFINLIL